jgi:hypothetical protein
MSFENSGMDIGFSRLLNGGLRGSDILDLQRRLAIIGLDPDTSHRPPPRGVVAG